MVKLTEFQLDLIDKITQAVAEYIYTHGMFPTDKKRKYSETELMLMKEGLEALLHDCVYFTVLDHYNPSKEE